MILEKEFIVMIGLLTMFSIVAIIIKTHCSVSVILSVLLKARQIEMNFGIIREKTATTRKDAPK